MVLKKTPNQQAKNRRVPEEAAIIGRNLRDLRRRTNLTQKDIAAILGITFQQVQKYERGDNRFPVEKLYQLKSYFSVPYEFFFRGLDAEEERAEWPHTVTTHLAQVSNPELQNKIARVVTILLE